jgi:hypothetical protein
MNKSIVVSAWSVQVAMLLMFGAMICWQVLPPPSPTLPIEEWAYHFKDNATGAFVGSMAMCLGTTLFFVFFGGLFACLKRMEGKTTPFTDALIMIMPFGFFPLFAMLIFVVEAAYRPEMSIETAAMLGDLSILMLVMPGFVGLVQWVLTGVIVLRDINPEPIFPRWVGYANIWVGLLSMPGSFIPFFKSGPFAWNGIFAFWVPAIVFGVMLTILMWAMLKAAKHPALQAT